MFEAYFKAVRMIETAFLMATACFAGALNSVAGGGTFFLFPALMSAGIPPVAANVTSTLAVWPASVTAALAFKQEMTVPYKALWKLALISLAGGAVGAGLLLYLPEMVFDGLVPWLLLLATLLFTFGHKLQRLQPMTDMDLTHPKAGLLIGQFLVSVYGGYFGAGIGILMLSLLAIYGMNHIHQMNALKTWLGMFINGVAVLLFIFSGQVAWVKLPLMVCAALLGGYLGAKSSMKIDKRYVKRFVIVAAWGITATYFVKRFVLV